MSVLVVRWMPRARRPAGEAHSWWIDNRPSAPLLFRQELVQVVALLAEQPRIGLVVLGRDARRLVLPRTAHVLFYRIRPRAQRIEIIALKQGNRRPPLL